MAASHARVLRLEKALAIRDAQVEELQDALASVTRVLVSKGFAVPVFEATPLVEEHDSDSSADDDAADNGSEEKATPLPGRRPLLKARSHVSASPASPSVSPPSPRGRRGRRATSRNFIGGVVRKPQVPTRRELRKQQQQPRHHTDRGSPSAAGGDFATGDSAESPRATARARSAIIKTRDTNTFKPPFASVLYVSTRTDVVPEVDDPARDQIRYTPLQGIVFAPITDDEPLPTAAAPAEGLELDFVYGCRSRDVRANLQLTAHRSGNHVVYFVARVVVLYDSEQRQQRFFTQHTADVCCLATHPNVPIVATGQLAREGHRDAMILVWDSRTLEVIRRLSLPSHPYGFSSLTFSPDGRYLLAVATDAQQSLVVWNWRDANLLLSGLPLLAPGQARAHVYGITSRSPRFSSAASATSSRRSMSSRVVSAATLLEHSTADDASAVSEGHSTTPDVMGVVAVAYGKGVATQVVFTPGDDGHMGIGLIPLSFPTHPNLMLTAAALEPDDGRCYLGTSTGAVLVVEETALIHEAGAHDGPVFSMLASSGALLTAGRDGKVVHWECSFGSEPIKPDRETSLHPRRIRSIASSDGQSLIAATVDGSIVQTSMSPTTTLEVLVPACPSHIVCVHSHPKYSLFATAASSGRVCVWDAGSHRLLASVDTPRPAACVRWSPDGTTLVVGLEAPAEKPTAREVSVEPVTSRIGAARGKVHHTVPSTADGASFVVFDAAVVVEDDDSGDERGADTPGRGAGAGAGAGASGSGGDDDDATAVAVQTVVLSTRQSVTQPYRVATVGCVRFCGKSRGMPAGSSLALGMSDGIIDVYSRGSDGTFRRKRGLKGHSGEVVQLDWSTDNRYLRSVSRYYQLFYWEPATGQRIKYASLMRDEHWLTESCALGWSVMGVWAAGTDGTDVNAVCATNGKRQLLAAADDTGKVKLFRYPAYEPEFPHKAYAGHSPHVSSVAFTAGNDFLLSTGAEDCAVFQWRVASTAGKTGGMHMTNRTQWFHKGPSILGGTASSKPPTSPFSTPALPRMSPAPPGRGSGHSTVATSVPGISGSDQSGGDSSADASPVATPTPADRAVPPPALPLGRGVASPPVSSSPRAVSGDGGGSGGGSGSGNGLPPSVADDGSGSPPASTSGHAPSKQEVEEKIRDKARQLMLSQYGSRSSATAAMMQRGGRGGRGRGRGRRSTAPRMGGS